MNTNIRKNWMLRLRAQLIRVYVCVQVNNGTGKHLSRLQWHAVSVFEPQAELTQESDLAAGAIGVRCWGHNETLGQLNLKSAWTDKQHPYVIVWLYVTCYNVLQCYGMLQSIS